MDEYKIYYRNRLPHIAPTGACFFATFRLGDSLPWKIVQQLRAERDDKIKQLIQSKTDDCEVEIYREEKIYFSNFDRRLDKNPLGNCYLRRQEVATIVIDQLRKHDGVSYELQAFCIMPNHVHVLLDTSIQLQNQVSSELGEGYIQLDRIMKRIKGASSRYANQFLGRTGSSFWQKDSYDHFVRNQKEWERILAYILNNPVKAGLVKDWQEWPYSYFKYL